VTEGKEKEGLWGGAHRGHRTKRPSLPGKEGGQGQGTTMVGDNHPFWKGDRGEKIV